MKSTEGLAGKELALAREENLTAALITFNSNVGAALGNEVRWTRFFKVLRREDGSWLALMGSHDEAGEPIVAFGNGKRLLQAVANLGRTMAADEWREDTYANKD